MRDLVFFIPSVEGGGVEKNLFYITNYFQLKFKNIYLISADKLKPHTFGKNIKLIVPNTNYFNNKKLVKSIICSYLLIKYFINRKILILFHFSLTFFNYFFKSN